MSVLPIGDLRVFVPAHDMELTADFYVALGWELGFNTPTLKLLQNNDHRFYLNNQFPESYTRHFRMHITVEDAYVSFDHVTAVVANDNRFSSVRIKPPEEQPYGAIVTYVYDTSGVLLDLCQWTNERAAEWAKARFDRLAQLKS
jgi:hypothetical protein